MKKFLSEQYRVLLFPAVAALLLLLSWILGKHQVLHAVFAVLSFLCSAAGLWKPLRDTMKSRNLTTGPALPLIAGILAVCTGAFSAGALLMLLWLLLPFAVNRLHSRRLAAMQSRLEQNPVRSPLPRLQEEPLPDSREQFLRRYFPYLMILLAALISVLTALITGSAGKGLRRAAAILAMGSAASFFSGYALSDFAAAIRAGELGVIFGDNSLSRALQLKLCCAETEQPEMIEDAAVFPVQGKKTDAGTLLSMAAVNMTVSDLASASRLHAVSQTPAPGEVKALPGFGAVSRTGQHALLTGSAELMNKAGIPMLPFRDGNGIVHIGVDGKYLGCIDLLTQPGEDTEALLAAAGFYCFRNAAEAEAQRQPGESVLYLTTQDPEKPTADDLFAVSGGQSRSAGIHILRRGKSGAAAMLENLGNARTMRRNLLLTALAVKAFALLLAIFGLCPVWLTAVFEFGVMLFSDFYSRKALDFTGKYGI